MTPKPTLLAPKTARVIEAIGSQLDHDSADETVQELIAHLGREAASDDPEQLAEQLAAGADAGVGGQSPADARAEETLTLSDLREMEREQLSPAEHLRENYGIEVGEFSSDRALHRRVREKRNEMTPGR